MASWSDRSSPGPAQASQHQDTVQVYSRAEHGRSRPCQTLLHRFRTPLDIDRLQRRRATGRRKMHDSGCRVKDARPRTETATVPTPGRRQDSFALGLYRANQAKGSVTTRERCAAGTRKVLLDPPAPRPLTWISVPWREPPQHLPIVGGTQLFGSCGATGGPQNALQL